MTITKNSIPVAIMGAGVLIAASLLYINMGGEKSLSSQEASEKALAFIGQSIEEDVTISLLGVTEETGFYKIYLQIEETEYESYISKDGKFLFPSGFNLEEQGLEEKGSGDESEAQPPSSLDNFAQCLTDSGMKFYGSEGCGWCSQEKELFGDSMAYINYIECLDEETGGATAECQAEGIYVPGGLGVPTWQLPDGELSPGYKSLEQLAELSECPLE